MWTHESTGREKCLVDASGERKLIRHQERCLPHVQTFRLQYLRVQNAQHKFWYECLASLQIVTFFVSYPISAASLGQVQLDLIP